MATASVYLGFNGNCEEAFEFYRAAFGGEFLHISRFRDIPEGMPVPEEDKDKILHVSLPLSGGTVLMGSDRPGNMPKATIGDNFSISIDVKSEAEGTKLFDALSADGKVTMPMQKTFWAAWFGMFVDRFGIQWMVNYDHPRA